MAKYDIQMMNYDGGWMTVDATDDPYEAVLMARNDIYEHNTDVRIVEYQKRNTLVDWDPKCVYYADDSLCRITRSVATQNEIARYGGYFYNGDRVIIEGEIMTNSFRQKVQDALTKIHTEGL